MKTKTIIIAALLVASTTLNAQGTVTADFEPKAWDITAKKHEFIAYKGKRALYLENGKARLKEGRFRNGIIEYDISFEEKRNFAGVHFRIQDELNFEEYYLRPHQSGNEDAMQYTPVINGNAGWQLYTGKGHWAAFPFKFGDWMHVKLVVSDTQMDVFIDDMATPILQVEDLKREPITGTIGFGTFLGAAHYANLSYQAIDSPKLTPRDSKESTPQNETVLDWEVSEAFPAKNLKSTASLAKLKPASFRKIKAEPSGILNLSQISPVTEESNAVIARFNLTADSSELRELEFGYSDAVTVFVNGIPVYSGTNGFRTRDYRYLGSIGFFDRIFLALNKGENEIAFAVSENFGGWGVMAKVIEE